MLSRFLTISSVFYISNFCFLLSTSCFASSAFQSPAFRPTVMPDSGFLIPVPRLYFLPFHLNRRTVPPPLFPDS